MNFISSTQLIMVNNLTCRRIISRRSCEQFGRGRVWGRGIGSFGPGGGGGLFWRGSFHGRLGSLWLFGRNFFVTAVLLIIVLGYSLSLILICLYYYHYYLYLLLILNWSRIRDILQDTFKLKILNSTFMADFSKIFWIKRFLVF